MLFRFLPRFCLALFAVCASFAATTQAQEVTVDTQAALAKELAPVVDEMYQWLKSRSDGGSLFIDAVSLFPPKANTTNKNLLKTAIAEALKERIPIKQQSNYSLSTKVTHRISSAGKGSVGLDFEVTSADTVKAFQCSIASSRVIAAVYGNNEAYDRLASENARNRQASQGVDDRAQDRAERQPPVADRTRIRLVDPRRNTAFAVEIAVRPKGEGEYVPQEIKFGDGSSLGSATPFVPIARGSEYQIRLYNEDPKYDIFAEVLVDGLNVLHFYNADQGKAFKPTQRISHWMVNRATETPGKQFISGWQRNNADANRFEVVSFPKSAVSELGLEDPGAIGTITVIYRLAWKAGETDPGMAINDGTGLGNSFKNPIVTEERIAAGTTSGQICIRYLSQE